MAIEKINGENIRDVNTAFDFDVNEVKYIGKSKEEMDNGNEIFYEYSYDVDISDYTYEFDLTYIEGTIYPDNAYKYGKETYKTGRIDFSVDGDTSEALTNVGLKNVFKGRQIIEELLLFLYTNHPDIEHIVLDASKASHYTNTKHGYENSREVIKKMHRMDGFDRNVIEVEYEIPAFRRIGIASIKIVEDGFMVTDINGNTKLRKISDIIDLINDPAVYNDEEVMREIMYFVDDISPENKKQTQRLKLYIREMKKIGFSPMMTEDGKEIFPDGRAYMYPEEMFKNKLKNSDTKKYKLPNS